MLWMAEKNVTLILTWAWSQCQKITKWLIKVSAAMATGTAFSWLPFSVLQLIWLLHMLHILTSLPSRAFTPVLRLSQFQFPPYLNSIPHSCWSVQPQCMEGRWHLPLPWGFGDHLVLPLIVENLLLPSHWSLLDLFIASSCLPTQ